MKPHNKRMQKYLAHYGIKARVKLIESGSMAGCWRLYWPDTKWTQELISQLSNIGFKDFEGKPLNQFSANGGRFSVLTRHILTQVHPVMQSINNSLMQSVK